MRKRAKTKQIKLLLPSTTIGYILRNIIYQYCLKVDPILDQYCNQGYELLPQYWVRGEGGGAKVFILCKTNKINIEEIKRILKKKLMKF